MLLAGIGPLGPVELGLILVIVVLIFGAGRLPEVGGAVGKSIREFRKASKDGDDDKDANTSKSAESGASGSNGVSAQSAPAASVADTIYCGECGAKNPRGAKFCAQCGHGIGTPVN